MSVPEPTEPVLTRSLSMEESTKLLREYVDGVAFLTPGSPAEPVPPDPNPEEPEE